jgi:hypothetical protein
MSKKFLTELFRIVMITISVCVSAQEATISEWGYGLETSYGLSSGYSPDSYSLSFQAMQPYGGWSIDWIQRNQDENSSGLLAGKTGLLGSLFFGIPLGDVFELYGGGGLGIGFADEIFFAWKVDGGAMVWLFDLFYMKAGVTYDNIRELGISAGVGFKFEKNVTATYRRADGSTFRRTTSKARWEDDSTSNYVYEDKFESSEVVRTYQKTTTTSTYTAPEYEWKTSGGETVTTTFKDQHGRTTGTATSKTEEKRELVQTKDGGYTTNYYVWNVTVTRNWYTRTYYLMLRGVDKNV